MISHLSIKDFAIIEDLELSLNDGLNIITGETGAGKSIIIEAISLALGSRADTSYIRTGKEKATVQLVAFNNEEEYIITREISSNGRNICRINGQIVPLSQVQEVCSKLADIHGQYDHQSLLNPDNHIRLLDLYAKETIEPAKNEISLLYSQWRDVSSKLKSLLSDYSNMIRQRDFMKFELDEITSANLEPGEDESLSERITVLQNSEKIYSSLEQAYQMIYGGESNITSALSHISSLLSQVSSYSAEIEKTGESLNSLIYGMEDITDSLRDLKEKAIFNPNELDECIQRLDTIENLKRKYAMDIEGIIAYSDEIASKLLTVENIDDEKERLTSLKDEYTHKLKAKCSELTELRKKASQELSVKILNELKDLNFKDADLRIEISPSDAVTAEGNDVVEFMITTNKGESLKPLAKVASGGEMSRIMLAFKKITGDYDRIPTMIFDEIDTGISGITASIVAKKLVEIGETHQILCITHLPQIAAAGKHNYLIQKDVRDESTFTDVIPLDEDGKINEIARLLGGINITETTRESAKELINASK